MKALFGGQETSAHSYKYFSINARWDSSSSQIAIRIVGAPLCITYSFFYTLF
jgi:hypothetical protein